MVAALLKLRFRILGNTLRRHPWQLVGFIFGALYGLMLLFLATAGSLALGFAGPEVPRALVMVVLGSAVTIGWWLLPMIRFGMEDILDPSRLITFPVPPRRMFLAIALSSMLGIPAIVTILFALAASLAWVLSPLALVAAIVCHLLGVIICILGSRALTTAAAGVTSGRRFREIAGIIVMVPLVLAGPIAMFLGEGISNIGAGLEQAGQVLGWTPLGIAWAVPGDIAAGNGLLAAARFVVLLVMVAIVVLWSEKVIRRSLENPTQTRQAARTQSGPGLFRFFPATPAGAIAARSLIYWLRDPRYARQLYMIPILVALFVFYAAFTDNNSLVIVAVAVVGLSMGMAIYADVSYDGSAYALHILRGIRGVDDRLGRVWAASVLGVPLTLATVLVVTAVTGSWETLPALLALGLGSLLTGLGTASVASAMLVIPVPEAGASPFASTPGSGMPTMLATFGVMGAMLVLMIPTIVFSILAYTVDSGFGWAALACALAIGGGAVAGGIALGGRTLDKRQVTLYARLLARA